MPLFRLFLASIAALLGAVVLLPFLAVAVLLWGMAGVVRGVAGLLEPRVLPWGAFVEFEPEIGWKPKPDVDAYHLVDDVFHVVTGPDGWPGTTSLHESDVVVFGDSFAWGYGIDSREFFANLQNRVRIKPIAASGYNMVQELLWMRRLSGLLTGKVVVWFVYYGNDLYENLVPEMGAYRMPFVRETNTADGWEIVTAHIRASKWPYTMEPMNEGRDYYGKLAEMCTDGFLARRAFGACEFLIRSGADLCDASAAQLVVVSVPDPMQIHPHLIPKLRRRALDPENFDPKRPDHILGEICRRLGVGFLPGCECFAAEHYKERDCHWNSSGHRRMADVLLDLHARYRTPTEPGVKPVPSGAVLGTSSPLMARLRQRGAGRVSIPVVRK